MSNLHPMSFRAINTDSFLEVLVNGREINSTDRDKVYLKSEEFGLLLTDGEIDNLIRRAVTIYEPTTTVGELKKIIEKSKMEIEDEK